MKKKTVYIINNFEIVNDEEVTRSIEAKNEEDIYNHYVAATRAKNKLILVYIDNDWNAGQFRMNINKILGKSSLKMKDVATVVNCIGCQNN